MIKELSRFINTLDPEMKALGMKPKEGLHLLLRINEKDNQLSIDKDSLIESVYTKKKGLSPAENAFLKRCATMIQLSWYVEPNKCFDLPMKAIHSCSPYCIAIKRENLTDGEKYKANSKSQVYERISSIYFKKTEALLDTPEAMQRMKLFEEAMNSEEKFNAWLAMVPAYEAVKDTEYVIFYLDEPIEKYERANASYLADKLFNTNEHNTVINEEIFGTSNFYNGYPTEKPFLTHLSASFDIANRVSAREARNLYEFESIIARKLLPNPLPIFIHLDEIEQRNGKGLLESSIALFKKDALNGVRRKYPEIMRELYDKHQEQLGNYYLLYYDNRCKIKDFDFVSKFEFLLKDDEYKDWEIQDLFGANNAQVISDVFHLQQAVLLPVFKNKNQTDDFQYKYFDELDASNFKSAGTYLLAMQYRRSFYNFIYKSKRQAITSLMFSHILQTSILDDIRLDEIKNGYHTEEKTIKEKLNIWFSLQEHFYSPYKTVKTNMPSSLQTHRNFLQKLSKGETHIGTDEEYAFTAGQVIYYLLSKSESEDSSHKRLEPFMQQVHAKELNKAITRLFDTYKHANFSSNFKTPFAELLSYTTDQNIRNLVPLLLAGYFSSNFLGRDKKTQEATTTEVTQAAEE